MKSIRKELLLTFGIVAVSAILLISLLFFVVMQNNIIPDTNKIYDQIAFESAKNVGNWIEKNEDMIEDFAISNSSSEKNWESLSNALQSFYEKNKNTYYKLFYTDVSGRGEDTNGKIMDLSYSENFKLLMDGKKETVITDPISLDNRKVFMILSAIKNNSGKIKGTIGGYIYLDPLSSIVKKINIGGEGYGWIVSKNGMILAHPNKKYILNFNILNDAEKYGYEGLDKIFNENSIIKYGVVKNPNNLKESNFFVQIPNSNGWYLGISALNSKLYKSINSLIFVIIISMVFVALALALATLLSSDGLSKNLKTLSLKIKDIENGNLNLRIKKTRKDEIGIIQESMNNLINKLNDILSKIKVTSTKISSVSDELSTSNEEFSKRILEDSTKIEQISASTQELTASFDMTAENANSSINIGQQTMHTTKESMKNMEKTVKSVEELAKISDKISEIMDFINKIAFQTNLLSVNASIEAARFGKDGSGFGAVAYEIRSLSKKISEYSLEIGKLLNVNQSKVKEVSNSTENAKNSFESMEKYISELVEKSNGISQSVVEQSDAIRQIADAIVSMSGSMQSNTEILGEISKITLMLSKEAHILNSINEQYNLRSESIKND